MILSKLTAKSQTTIPLSVRRALKLQPGDELHYEIVDGRVILTKADHPPAPDDPFASFDEWNSDADRKAYANL